MSVVAGPLAAASAKKAGPQPLPVPTVVVGPQVTVDGDELTFTVLLVGPSTGGAFQFQSLSVFKGPSATTFTPALVIATGSQSFTVTASPLAIKGTQTMVLDAIYAGGGGGDRLVESAATRVSVGAAQAFGKRPPPWLR
ncbi:MAG TPA: hypothetical protein VI110_01850 [Lapillicoccus sp.]